MARLSLAQAKEIFRQNHIRVGKNYDGYYLRQDYEITYRGLTGHEVVRLCKQMFPVVVTTVTFDPITFTDRTFGVEIETFHPTNRGIKEDIARALTSKGIATESQEYNHRVQRIWKVTTDASISGGYGAEVVSPILSGEAGLQELKTVLETLEELGCRVNRTTGLHVHHNMQDCESAIRQVYEFYRANERHFDSLLPQSRRGNNNTYCGSLQGRTYNAWVNGTRYVKINYQSFLKYGTLEVRHHSGTLNFDKVEHWIKLTQAMIEWCAQGHTAKSFNSLEEMMSTLNITDQAWYLERREDLAC